MPASSSFLLSLSHAAGKAYCGILIVMPQPTDYTRLELQAHRVDGRGLPRLCLRCLIAMLVPGQRHGADYLASFVTKLSPCGRVENCLGSRCRVDCGDLSCCASSARTILVKQACQVF